MKKALIAAATLAVLTVAACKKEYYSNSGNGAGTGTSTTITTPTYSIDGITDLTLEKTDSGVTPNTAMMFLQVNNGVRNQERLRLSLSGKPAGIRDSFSVTTGYPTFTTMLTLRDSGVAVGTYPMKLVVVGDSSGRREFAFDLKVNAAPQCTGTLVDTGYATASPCNPTGNYTTSITATGVRNQIRINNIDGAGGSIIANLNCGLNTVTIPSQTSNGVSYTGGNGFFFTSGSARNLDFSLTISIGSGGTRTCNVTMNK